MARVWVANGIQGTIGYSIMGGDKLNWYRCPSHNALRTVLGSNASNVVVVSNGVLLSTITATTDPLYYRLIPVDGVLRKATLSITYQAPYNFPAMGVNVSTCQYAGTYISFSYNGVDQVRLYNLPSGFTYCTYGNDLKFMVVPPNESLSARTFTFTMGANDIPVNQRLTFTITQDIPQKPYWMAGARDMTEGGCYHDGLTHLTTAWDQYCNPIGMEYYDQSMAPTIDMFQTITIGGNTIRLGTIPEKQNIYGGTSPQNDTLHIVYLPSSIDPGSASFFNIFAIWADIVPLRGAYVYEEDQTAPCLCHDISSDPSWCDWNHIRYIIYWQKPNKPFNPQNNNWGDLQYIQAGCMACRHGYGCDGHCQRLRYGVILYRSTVEYYSSRGSNVFWLYLWTGDEAHYYESDRFDRKYIKIYTEEFIPGS